jgi:hypothetical protein
MYVPNQNSIGSASRRTSTERRKTKKNLDPHFTSASDLAGYEQHSTAFHRKNHGPGGKNQ